LLLGRFRGGWNDYRWRWKRWESEYLPTPAQPYPLLTPDNVHAPVWDGQPTPGRLLVWPEQGIGDQMLFASMLGEAQKRVGGLTLALDPRLHPLFARSFPQARIVTLEMAFIPGSFDCQILFGNLGGIFRNDESDFLSHRRPYLKADPARTAVLRRLLTAGGKRVCGIAWHSRHEKVGQDKSMRLTDLVPVLSLPGCRFVDLQYGDHAAEHDALRREAGLALARVPEIDNWNDIDGLAALINACDLIITVSNTSAHIAGALGKPVLLMLPYSTGRYWYWQTGRDDSLVYPDLRIFRQAQAGDWSTVATAVSRAAKERLSGNDVKTQTPAIVTGRLPNPQISLSRAQRFFDEDQFAEALDAVNHALALDSRLDAAHNLRGNVLMAIGRYADAGTAYEQALALTPDSAITKNNLRLCRLMTGHFREAWRTHGARWQAWQDMGIPDIKPPDYAKLPRWEGAPLQGSLVVWGEQGIGDQILWCSMLAEARARVSSLTVAVHPKLQALFKRAFPDCEVTTADRAGPLRRHSAQLPMGDLGALFRNSEADFLTHLRAYLQADKARAAALRLQLSSNGQMICGLSWLSRNPRSSAFKSLDFAQLHPLLSLKGFRFVNLQHDSGIDVTPAMTEVESIDKWNDLDGLAALIAACDLVVTTSNTVAHLAGALGVRVLLMLPTRPYWYWQPDRRDSLWYPKIDIFRQPASGDWAGVVRRVAKALAPPPPGRRTVAHVSRGAPAAKT
jgi:tetratricopeptide (TPR) repeat protein